MTATNDGFTCTTQTFDYRELPTATTHGVDPATCTGTGQDTVTHTYDGLGRLVRDKQGSLRSIDDTFDAVGNRLRSAPVSANSSGTTTTITTDFDVNVVDQVVSETRTEDTTIRMSKTTYDPAWNPVDRCRWEAGATTSDSYCHTCSVAVSCGVLASLPGIQFMGETTDHVDREGHAVSVNRWHHQTRRGPRGTDFAPSERQSQTRNTSRPCRVYGGQCTSRGVPRRPAAG